MDDAQKAVFLAGLAAWNALTDEQRQSYFDSQAAGGNKMGAAPPIDPADPPTLMQKAASLTKAVVAHVADGARLAPPEVQAERERQCLACPKYDATAGKCRECGCILMKTKRSWASSACPLNPPRWDAVP